MFVDFDKVFNSKPQPQMEIPEAFIAYLNKQLPEGVKYVLDDDGNCVITADGASFTLGGFEFVVSQEDKKILGKAFSRDDILHLFYNRQKPIPLQLEKEGIVLLNGKEFPVDKMFLNPHNPISKQSGSFFMSPSPLPGPFVLAVGCKEYERNVFVSRIPHNSVNTMAFESDKSDPLRVSYLIAPEEQKLTMSMSFNLSRAKTIRDIVECIRIYNAYLDGEGYLCGQPLETKLTGESVKRFEETIIEFWEKVLAIEDCLDVVFAPPREDVDFDTICLVEQLYQNLVQKTPIRETGKPDTLDGKWESKNEADILASIGTAIYFEFEATRTVELFGAKFTLYGLLGIIDAVLADYVTKGKKQKIVLSDVSEDRPRHTTSLFFKSEKDMIEYRDSDRNERLTAFHKAKRARDYLKTE